MSKIKFILKVLINHKTIHFTKQKMCACTLTLNNTIIQITSFFSTSLEEVSLSIKATPESTGEVNEGLEVAM